MKPILLLITLATGAALAQPRNGPPPEALKACESKKAGDACSFTGPPGKLEGSCFTPESTKPLACRPKNAPEGGPPQQGQGPGQQQQKK